MSSTFGNHSPGAMRAVTMSSSSADSMRRYTRSIAQISHRSMAETSTTRHRDRSGPGIAGPAARRHLACRDAMTLREPEQIAVLVADRQPIFLAGLVRTIRLDTGLRLVAGVED